MIHVAGYNLGLIMRLLTGAGTPREFHAAEALRALEGGTRPFQRPTDSGRISTRRVCGGGGVWICGGPKPGMAEPGTLVFVRAGTLDDTSWLRPSVHLWTDSAQPWVALPDGDVRFEMQPANYPAWLWSNTG